jgi:hypothetical protein
MPPIFVGFLVRSSSVEGTTPAVCLRLIVAVKPRESPEFNGERIAAELARATLLTLLPENAGIRSMGRLSPEEVKECGQPQIERPFEQGMVYVYELSDNSLT